jgi:DNA-binding transcriptional regulator YdaS (Cro superfamily)
MNLHEYIEKHSQTELARLLDVAPSFVHQWVRGTRPIPIQICVEIEQKTGGDVTRKDLRPDDWKAIWPELSSNAKQAA